MSGRDVIGYLQRQVRELAKKRAYCKNTVAGKQRGKKYPAAFRAEVVMAMLGSNSICAVAKRYGVPESTIRSWMSEEAGRSDAFAKARQEAAREIAIRASLGVRAQVTFLQGRAAESQRAAQITERLHRRLDEDTRARAFAVGTLLKDDPEELADATETGLVVYGRAGTRNLRLYEDERDLLNAELERYEGRVMSDKNAAGVAKVLMEVAEKAAAMAPAENTDSESGPPMVEIAAASETDGQQEVEVDGGTEDA